MFYCLQPATTFSHLAGSLRIPSPKDASSFQALIQSTHFFLSSHMKCCSDRLSLINFFQFNTTKYKTFVYEYSVLKHTHVVPMISYYLIFRNAWKAAFSMCKKSTFTRFLALIYVVPNFLAFKSFPTIFNDMKLFVQLLLM